MSQKSHGLVPSSETYLYLLALSERFGGCLFSCCVNAQVYARRRWRKGGKYYGRRAGEACGGYHRERAEGAARKSRRGTIGIAADRTREERATSYASSKSPGSSQARIPVSRFMYFLPSSVVGGHGVGSTASHAPRPPCHGGRSPIWRTKTAASVGGVVFA